ncbi:MAG: hypothetical protein OM95_05455 [Bdellovibrio sp. ArHS]|uniref:hypothetical protein n=1 Tax=Bdellovibrio sp. ArHS TaxID=1569284 RepID=UPI0005824BAC|nr:hypothetical protein [Bdellovibrio sp. ArHS]KHD88924.1 MAG: hypothetical protein OM95_05455 [Bdellovibrio sp. ArHS]
MKILKRTLMAAATVTMLAQSAFAQTAKEVALLGGISALEQQILASIIAVNAFGGKVTYQIPEQLKPDKLTDTVTTSYKVSATGALLSAFLPFSFKGAYLNPFPFGPKFIFPDVLIDSARITGTAASSSLFFGKTHYQDKIASEARVIEAINSDNELDSRLNQALMPWVAILNMEQQRIHLFKRAIKDNLVKQIRDQQWNPLTGSVHKSDAYEIDVVESAFESGLISEKVRNSAKVVMSTIIADNSQQLPTDLNDLLALDISTAESMSQALEIALTSGQMDAATAIRFKTVLQNLEYQIQAAKDVQAAAR